MLKRSKTDEEIDLEEADAGAEDGSILVINDDADACELIARLMESVGWQAIRSYDIDAVGATVAKERPSGVVIDSMRFGITTAFELLNEIRAGGPDAQDVPVVIIAATDTNRLFAYQSGADGFLVRPVHADELLEAMLNVITRSPAERADFRRSQLLGGANTA